MSLFTFRRPAEKMPPTEEPDKDAGPAPAAQRPAEGALPGPYATGAEHLWDELRRVDQLIRAATIRWRATIADHKSEQLWGMVHVTDAEVSSFLRAPFVSPGHLPPELTDACADYWQAANDLKQMIEARLAQTPPQTPLPLRQIQSLFNLSNLERDILLVCLWPELDARYRRLFGYLQDDASRRTPSTELALQILQPTLPDVATGRAAFDAAASLFTHQLLEIGSDGGAAEPLTMRSIRLDDRIAGFLLGSDALDERLAGVASQPGEHFAWDTLLLDPERLARLQAIAAWWRQQNQSGHPAAVLFMHGPYGSGRLAAARAMCTATDTPLLIAAVGPALRSGTSWERIVALCYREAALRGAALYWADCELLLESDQPAHRWQTLLSAAEQQRGLSFLASEVAWDPTGSFHATPFLRLDFPMPGFELRLRLWQKHLPASQSFAAPAPDRNVLINALANGFQLTEGRIVDAVSTARALAARRDPQHPVLTSEDVYEGCRRKAGRRLMSFARRIEPRADLTFDHLILPEPNKRQLLELRTRIRYRSQVYTGFGFDRRLSLGRGLIALFTGSSGTGKTMAAELLAREQGVDLYKVDLSAVVSKYVGETEKNLSRVFAEAEDANAILFFDEADALFGKRGEVREAQDRWANMEVNYLLQRVEEYAGVVVLASNLRQNIDEAFLRRFHSIVEFPFPDAEARLRILWGLFPPGIQRPTHAELRSLSDRFKLAGGSYKNIVLDAAFRALSDARGQPPTITLRHLVDGTAREFQKLGQPITLGEFGEAFYAWVERDIL